MLPVDVCLWLNMRHKAHELSPPRQIFGHYGGATLIEILFVSGRKLLRHVHTDEKVMKLKHM